MKILVLNGSPKRDKSDTMHITRAFLDGMNEVNENEIKTINVIDKHIEYCTGCFACMRNGGDCIYHDDMKEILEEILISDLLIWSYPLYCYGMPAPLKALLDRTLPLSGMAMQKVGTKSQQAMQKQYEEKSLSVSSDPASRKKPKNSGFLSLNSKNARKNTEGIKSCCNLRRNYNGNKETDKA